LIKNIAYAQKKYNWKNGQSEDVTIVANLDWLFCFLKFFRKVEASRQRNDRVEKENNK